MKRGGWADDEVQFIIDNYDGMTSAAIADALGKSAAAVRSLIYAMQQEGILGKKKRVYNLSIQGEERATAVEMWQQGVSIPEIARKLDRDAKVVRRAIGDEYDPMRDATGRRGSPLRDRVVPMLGEIYARYLEGETLKQIESEIGVSDSYLEDLLKSHDYELDPSRRGRRSEIGPYEFIEAWQAAGSIEELQKTLDYKLSYKALSARASYYRNRGVPLKRMGHTAYDWQDLINFAKSLEQDEE